MQNKQVKNLKVLGASLCLGTVLLTGCGEARIPVGDSDIILEEGKTTGSISYQDIDKGIKIVFLELNGEINYQLLSIEKVKGYVGAKGDFYVYRYYDLSSGACLIEYNHYILEKFEDSYRIGKELDIVDEKPITPYLISENFIQKEYTVEELLTFFNEKVLPTLENNNKELVK